MGGTRDWLVLSLKWSQAYPKPEDFIWYRTNDNGYTSDLWEAGRYTEDEARSRESEGVTMAVPSSAALAVSRHVVAVEASLANVEALRSAAWRPGVKDGAGFGMGGK